MYARVVLGATKSVPFREVSSIQGCPYRGVPLYILCPTYYRGTPYTLYYYTHTLVLLVEVAGVTEGLLQFLYSLSLSPLSLLRPESITCVLLLHLTHTHTHESTTCTYNHIRPIRTHNASGSYPNRAPNSLGVRCTCTVLQL